MAGTERIKFALRIKPETMKLVEDNMEQANCRSKTEYIERAILFYSGFLSSDNYSEYLPSVMKTTMSGALKNLENRIATLLFKNCVEMSMLLHAFAAGYDLDLETMDELREMCIRQVKSTNGTISLEEAWKFQRRIDPKMDQD